MQYYFYMSIIIKNNYYLIKMKLRQIIFLNPSYFILCKSNDEYNPYKKKVKFCGGCCCCKKDPTEEERLKEQLKNINGGEIVKTKIIKVTVLKDNKEQKVIFDSKFKTFIKFLRSKNINDLKNLNCKTIRKELKDFYKNEQNFDKSLIRKDNIKNLLCYIKLLIKKLENNEKINNEEDNVIDSNKFKENIYFDEKSLIYTQFKEIETVKNNLINNILEKSNINDDNIKNEYKKIVESNFEKCKNECQFKDLEYKTDKFENDHNTIFNFAILNGDRREDVYNLLFNFKNLDQSKLKDETYLKKKCFQYNNYFITEEGGNKNTDIKLEKKSNEEYEIKFKKETKKMGLSFNHEVNVNYKYSEFDNEFYMFVKSNAKCNDNIIKSTVNPNVSVNIFYQVIYNETFNTTFINVYSRLSFQGKFMQFVGDMFKKVKDIIYQEATYNMKLFLKEDYLKKIEDEEYLENLTK